MNLKFDSFFVKKYLQIRNPYRVPTNVCELAKEFAFVTFLYALILSLVGLVLSIEGFVLYKLALVAFTDATWATVFAKGSEAREMFVGFLAINCIFALAVIVWGTRALFNFFNHKYRVWKANRRGDSESVEHEPSAVVALAKSWYADFKAKTCTTIEYTDMEDAKNKWHGWTS